MKTHGSDAGSAVVKMQSILTSIDAGQNNIENFQAATGLQRAQVFNLLKQMRKAGVVVKFVRGFGYRIENRGPFSGGHAQNG